jgi:RimJ/RimL family protein N-acetyltransferase
MTWPGLQQRMEGERVILEPLAPRHSEGLRAAADHREVWRWLVLGDFDRWLADALAAARAGDEAPFATLDARTERPIGATRYLALRPEHRGLEIGWTWLEPAAWRTGANVEAKLLMLRHAFEELGCLRVEFKTHAANDQSRRAMEALPARFEGIHRKHMVIPGLGVRDSAYYSIIDDEWPGVKANLERRLEAVRAA